MSKPSSFGIDVGNQSFWVVCPGFPRLRFSVRAALDGRPVRLAAWKPAGSRGGGTRFLARTKEGTWELCFSTRAGSPGVQVALAAKLRQPSASVLLEPFVADVPAGHVLTHGRKMGGCDLRFVGADADFPVESHFLVALTHKGTTLQLSHPLEQDHLSRFSGRASRGKIRELTASTLIAPNRSRSVVSAPVTLAASVQGHDLIGEWADAQAGGREPVAVPQESGWNSWDYYRWTITEEEVCRNAEFIASDPVLSRHIKRIMVDDGWQYCYGEWEPNPLFPSGMQRLSRTLRRMGFTPGLWFAPTIAEPHARIAQLQPETLATGASGFPCLAFSCMERKGFLLDPTHPFVRAWWDGIFRRYAGYGYRYFKLDFLAWTVKARKFHDPAARPGALMRRIMEPIRQAVGPHSRILGCNYNLEDPSGWVDDVRVSGDIHACWRCVKENAASIAVRYWAHERFWVNDPDFTLCRGEETSEDPDLHRLKAMLPFVRPDDTNPRGIDYLDSLVDLGRRQAEVLISLVITSGGAMNLSDNLPRLNAAGLGMLRKAVSAEKGAAAVPLDLFTSEHPSTWIQKLASGLHRILLVNWEDRPRLVSVDLAALNVPRRVVRNFWSDESVPVRQGRLSVKLPARSCLLAESRN
ncbi:MAG TPA: hypothetical protein PLS03_13180 [Terrimicrobiaceae bacterium]|nr:hypothetical protein [Terrimicrobiaceae bacterium]